MVSESLKRTKVSIHKKVSYKGTSYEIGTWRKDVVFTKNFFLSLSSRSPNHWWRKREERASTCAWTSWRHSSRASTPTMYAFSYCVFEFFSFSVLQLLTVTLDHSLYDFFSDPQTKTWESWHSGVDSETSETSSKGRKRCVELNIVQTIHQNRNTGVDVKCEYITITIGIIITTTTIILNN